MRTPVENSKVRTVQIISPVCLTTFDGKYPKVYQVTERDYVTVRRLDTIGTWPLEQMLSVESLAALWRVKFGGSK